MGVAPPPAPASARARGRAAERHAAGAGARRGPARHALDEPLWNGTLLLDVADAVSAPWSYFSWGHSRILEPFAHLPGARCTSPPALTRGSACRCSGGVCVGAAQCARCTTRATTCAARCARSLPRGASRRRSSSRPRPSSRSCPACTKSGRCQLHPHPPARLPDSRARTHAPTHSRTPRERAGGRVSARLPPPPSPPVLTEHVSSLAPY